MRESGKSVQQRLSPRDINVHRVVEVVVIGG
jgi:hypothetical protein